ncbi:Imm7 family immunity protein [Streptomyces violascens]|uniref:Imm7 family immunity protein n=1 Tax=Streptomyces violascens TaxID=67381 RepID=UPI0036493DAC
MDEFHGWFGIAESPEAAGTGTLDEGLAELRDAIGRIDWATGEVTLKAHNGEYFVRADGLVNRRRDEAEELDTLVHFAARRFPGSWGLLHERSADLSRPFTVRRWPLRGVSR